MRAIDLSPWQRRRRLQGQNGARRHLILVAPALQVQGRNSHRESLPSSAGLQSLSV